ncbi:MAG: arylsulfotransferase family protein [Cyclobacteriaceae bacterium]
MFTKRQKLILLTIFMGLFSCVQEQRDVIPLPTSLPIFDVKVNRGDAFKGYVMVRQIENPGAQLAIDSRGKVAWFMAGDTTLFRPFTPYGSSFISLHSSTRAFDISYAGDTLNSWDISKDTSINFTMHHEVIKAMDGSLVTLTKEYVASDLSTNEPDARIGFIKNEGIVKLSPEGEVIWRWSFDRRFDVEGNPLEEQALPWGHANAILVNKQGNYLISWKGYNEVWCIDSSSGNVLWKYSGKQEGRRGGMIGQHSLSYDSDGNYLVFNNGRKSSSAHSFNVDGENNLTGVYDVALPDSLFSSKQGSVYQFAEDRYLFCSSQTKSLVVTNKQGEILWLAESDYVSYRAYHIPKEWID